LLPEGDQREKAITMALDSASTLSPREHLMPIEPTLFERIGDYITAIGIYWWTALAILLGLERIAERFFHNFWKVYIDPWFTPQRRKQVLLIFFVVAFCYSNFRAFQGERAENRVAISAVNNANTQIAELQKELAKLRQELAFVQRISPPKDVDARNPDGLYQLNELVGTVEGARVDQGNSLISFQAIRAYGKLDASKNVEYRNYTLHCDGLPQAPGPNTIVGVAIGVSIGARCSILGLRK
jgi:hypothetical protein